MKLVIALLLILTTGSNLFSQEKASLDKLVTIKLPPGIKKTDYVSVKARNGRGAKSSGVNFNPKIGNLFETDAGIIQINAAKGKAEKGRLESREKSMRELYGWGNPKYLTSEIKSINNFKVLVVDYQRQGEDIGRIEFFTVNNNQDIAMSGRMEYEKGNSDQALKTLDEFLKGLKFK